MQKVWISAGLGVGAGLLLAAVYLGAPYAGVVITPTSVMVAAAIIAFGSTISLLTLSALSKPEKKIEPSKRRLGDLGMADFAHFPTSGARITLRPDTVIEELDIVRSPNSYTTKDVFLTIKKSTGKTKFNPTTIRGLFNALKNFGNFVHILLVNEFDEYIGYMPAAWARLNLTGPNASMLIEKYIIDVLDNPSEKSIDLRAIGGLDRDETAFDSEKVGAVLKRASDGLLRGFVVFKDKRIRKPIGVIYEEDLVRLNMPEKD